jgi:hypothetical protein
MSILSMTPELWPLAGLLGALRTRSNHFDQPGLVGSMYEHRVLTLPTIPSAPKLLSTGAKVPGPGLVILSSN